MTTPVPLRSRTLAALVAAVAATGLLAACGDDDDDGGTSGGGAAQTAPAGELKTGPGVSAKQIRLGVLTDLSGVFAGLGKPVSDGVRTFWRVQNDKGGVCGRQVVLDVKDTGYDPQRAVSQYRTISDDVLALDQVLGSAVTAALLPQLQSDGMLAVLAGFPSQLVANPNVVVVGATYDIEMINALDHLVEEGKLAKGDKIGHIYFEGEYGENALAGLRYAAGKQGVEVVEQKIKASQTDMSGQVTALRRAGVKAIAMSAGPAQTAAAAGLAAAGGLDVPIVGSGPTFDPALLKTPAAKALEKNFTISAGTAPYALDVPAVQEATAAYEKAYPKASKQASALSGYAEASLMHQVLEKACENKDLTREGVQQALRQLDSVDLGGVVAGTLDFTEVGTLPARAVYLGRVNPDVEGGIEALGEATASENAESYTPEGS